MIKHSIGKYYYFGTEMRFLQDVREGVGFKGEGLVDENIKRFLTSLKNLELKVTYLASRKLRELYKQLEESEVKMLDASQAADLSIIMTNIRMTLDAEISGIYAFITTPKRLDSEKILEDMP